MQYLYIRERGFFEIFDTVYSVASLVSGKESDGHLKKPSIVNWSLPLFPVDTLIGVQQRLQIMGYYTGVVDGKMDELTERAILEFQADEGSLLINGEPDFQTQIALDNFFTTKGIELGSGLPIIRRYLVSFSRAVRGYAQFDSPHPDNRGGDTPIVSYFIPKGIVSWFLDFLNIKEREQIFKIKMIMENIAPRSKNIYFTIRPNDTTKLEIVKSWEVFTTNIPPVECMVKDIGDAKILVRFGAIDGPIIGEIDVKIVPLLQVNIFLHILDIRDNGGNSVVNKWSIERAKQLMGDINAIWAPVGVEFKVDGSESHLVIGKYAGTITNEIDSTTNTYRNAESDLLWRRYNKSGKINIYFANDLLYEYIDGSGNIVDRVNNVMGYALSRKKAGVNGLVGVCVKFDDDSKRLARTVAHELGHMLGLTSHPKAHSDDDGDDTPFRHDIWSRRRLMSKYIRYDDRDPLRQWQDTGYGKSGNLMNAGCLITIKKLKNDGTDEELKIARDVVDRELVY